MCIRDRETSASRKQTPRLADDRGRAEVLLPTDRQSRAAGQTAHPCRLLPPTEADVSLRSQADRYEQLTWRGPSLAPAQSPTNRQNDICLIRRPEPLFRSAS